jgi:LmbE family N-acetylglucosaminyl deacetylase
VIDYTGFRNFVHQSRVAESLVAGCGAARRFPGHVLHGHRSPGEQAQSYYNPSVPISRRSLLASAALALQGPSKPRKIVVTGGHPGDPECGCAGTIARYTSLGHDVALLYLNRGEGFCGAASLHRCAAIRTAEAQRACQILKARAVFADQVDGRAIVDARHYASFASILTAEEPDVVFTQWPIDRHRDHRAISMLTLDAWWKSGRSYAFYYYEVAEDTSMFSPAEYVDISPVESVRHAACYAHVSQKPDLWYPKQVEITRRRGAESGFAQAEGFLRHPESQRGLLP